MHFELKARRMINVSKPIIGKEEIEAVVSVMESGMIVQGPKTAQLEEVFAKYCGTKYAIAVNSGTAALHAGLYALRISQGDEVITSPFTFVASANAILMQNAKVVFADISENDFSLDPEEVKKKITDKTKAILPIDLYGQVYDYESMKVIAEKHNLKIVEDACQAIGAEYKGLKAGHFGDVSAFSLYATKNIMSGEGGMITTNDEELMEKCKRFRHHGQSEKTRYEYWDIGYNYRMTDMSAAIGLVQLTKVEELNEKRRLHARMLTEGLSGIKGLILPTVGENRRHVFHQYTIRITEEFETSREQLIDFLNGHGIGSAIYYPKPLHLHSHFSELGYKEGDFPVAEKLAKQVLSLPVHPSLTAEEIRCIIDKVQEYAT